MKRYRLLLVLVALSSTPLLFTQGLSGDIIIDVSGLRSDDGLVRATLYDSPSGFPNDLSKALDVTAVEIRGGEARLVFARYPHGTYAIGLFHDENRNGVMDANVLGIPQEGSGASNDARGRLGPPRFQDAAFQHEGPVTTLAVTVAY